MGDSGITPALYARTPTRGHASTCAPCTWEKAVKPTVPPPLSAKRHDIHTTQHTGSNVCTNQQRDTMSIWGKEKDPAAEKDKRERRARKEKAKIDRYEAKTKIREKNGGAGMTIRFYDIALPDGRTARVRKKKK